MSTQAVNSVVFYHDEDEPYLRLFESHLSPLLRDGTLEMWHRGKLRPGQNHQEILADQLSRADLILLLISADFVHDLDERVPHSVQRLELETMCLIPINLRPCIWQGLPFSTLQAIPTDGQPLVNDGVPNERRFHKAAIELRDLLAELRSSPAFLNSRLTLYRSTIVSTIAKLERERFALTRGTSRSNDNDSALINPGLLQELRLLSLALGRTDKYDATMSLGRAISIIGQATHCVKARSQAPIVLLIGTAVACLVTGVLLTVVVLKLVG